MAQVPFQALYNGPYAVYTSPTGMASPITGIPYLGGVLHEGDYVDLTRPEAAIWNVQYGNKLYPGRYRLGMEPLRPQPLPAFLRHHRALRSANLPGCAAREH